MRNVARGFGWICNRNGRRAALKVGAAKPYSVRRANGAAGKGHNLTQFQALGLDDHLLKAIAGLGFSDPTPIQERAIPLVLEGRDIMGLAQTGTGKTAAFGLPIIQQLLAKTGKPDPKTCKALILAPTRELVNQIAVNLRAFTKGSPIKVNSVVGGMSIGTQIKALALGSDIVVATPGRLLDLVKRQALRLDSARHLVLDEADQMLDLGFIHALREISRLVGQPRQTLLFSATMPKQMNEIAAVYLKDPVRVQVTTPGKTADKVNQSAHFVEPGAKLSLLKQLLSADKDALSLVFARTKHGAEKLSKTLAAAGFASGSIHGNKSQG
ncbi:MAG TPA: DEAD/DEAH box helicase, partial [Pelagibacterium sp.]|nr:DEAD/DEAH box helicase [Pelagibacterium sp.]